jgi:hypothetical protein
MVILFAMAVKRIGKLGATVREMKVPTVQTEALALTGKGREYLSRCVY